MNNLSLGVSGLMLLSVFFLVCSFTESLRVAHHRHASSQMGKATKLGHEGQVQHEERLGVGMELYPTGSSLPDCAYACGACSPCKRVMVSFKCSMAESCPIVYRCMCKGKYYHVPSN